MASILGMGNPLLDISAVVKPELLKKYNLKPNDAILYEKEDIFEDLVKDYTVEYIAGGATQNSCRVAQWILEHPNSVAYFGYFDVDEKTGEMVRYNVYPENVIHPYSHIPSQMEIMDSFFKPHQIIVNWINCNGTYGGYDFEQRKWTGMVGKVRNLFSEISSTTMNLHE